MVTKALRPTLRGLLVLSSIACTLAPVAGAGQALTLVTVRALTPAEVGVERAARVAASADGRYIAFCSGALPGDLVPGTNRPAADPSSNVYVRDLVTNSTQILTVSALDSTISSNGTCSPDVQITPDGRYVAFKSTATNLLGTEWVYQPGNTSGFVYDRQTGSIVLVDVANPNALYAAGVKAMVMSENGRFVAFSSAGTGETRLIPNFIDANGSLTDLYVRDLQAPASTRLVSRDRTNRNQGSPSGVEASVTEHPRVMSADGKVLLFAGASPALVVNGVAAKNLYAYKWDNDTGDPATAISLVSAKSGLTLPGQGVVLDADDVSTQIYFSLTADGAFAAFSASTSQEELVTGVTTAGVKNVYVRDVRTAAGVTGLMSVRPPTLPGNGDSRHPIVSRDGSTLVFESVATNLIPGATDAGAFVDVFAEPLSGWPTVAVPAWLSRAYDQQGGGNQDAVLEDVSTDGRYVAWRSAATNYIQSSVVADGNGADDVFVRDRVANTIAVRSVVPSGSPSTGDKASNHATLLSGGLATFFSDATNLLITPTTSVTNIFAPAPDVADLSVSITDAPDPVIAGQQVVYTVTATNLGPSSATGVTVTVPVPDGATSIVGQGGVAASGGTLSFAIGAVNVNAGVTRTVTVVYGAARTASVTATVTATQADPNTANNTATQSTTVVADATRPSISGTVRDQGSAPLAGVTVAISGSATHATTTGADGTYSLTNLPIGGNLTVTPSATGYTFTPPSTSFTNVTADQVANFTAACAPAISGLVRDRLDGAVAGVAVDITGARTGTVLTDADGRYTFDGLALGQSFTITPSKAGFTFAPSSVTVTSSTCGTTPATFVVTAGSFTRYFAEGATSGFFDTTLALLNASGVATTVRLTFQTATGANVVHDVAMAGLARATVDPKAIPGLETAEFSTVVASTQPIIADRTMHWDASGYGSHAETSIAEPLFGWYLAEGATTGNFQLFYLIQNPNDAVASVQVTYLLPAPSQPFTKTYSVPARSRQNIWVNVEDARLAQAEVSAVFASSLPVIVERAMYRDAAGQVFAAGHEAAAVPGPATQWFFAEGATGSYFDLFYLIANPGATAAVIDGRYLLPDGTVLTKQYSVAAKSRFNVWADYETFEGRAGLPLENTAVSATFTSANGVPFVAERAMWWPNDANQWFEGHDSAGALRSGTKWALADGEAGGRLGTETYILIANTSNADGTVRVTLVYEDGTTSVLTRPVRANSRTNVAVGAEVAAAVNRRFAAIVESLGPSPVQIVVERAMYNDAGGVTWAAGSNNLGTRLR